MYNNCNIHEFFINIDDLTAMIEQLSYHALQRQRLIPF